MGVINHNAVLATTWSAEAISKVSDWISKQSEDMKSLFLIGDIKINGEGTIVMVPDGSKEDWVDSDNGDIYRQEFIKRLKEDNYEDGSSPWRWVEVGYGEYGQKVLDGNNNNCHGDEDYAMG